MSGERGGTSNAPVWLLLFLVLGINGTILGLNVARLLGESTKHPTVTSWLIAAGITLLLLLPPGVTCALHQLSNRSGDAYKLLPPPGLTEGPIAAMALWEYERSQYIKSMSAPSAEGAKQKAAAESDGTMKELPEALAKATDWNGEILRSKLADVSDHIAVLRVDFYSRCTTYNGREAPPEAA